VSLKNSEPAAFKPPAAIAGRRQAVIDVGSNSVRLVIYEGPARAPFPICNEKALCGLGRDMGPGGRLDAGAVDGALDTLRRFRRLIAEHGDPPTRVFATAAVREAADGPEFVRAIDALGFSTDVIDGAEEARLAAYGVVSYEPAATGLVGDMGGGSLELVQLAEGELRDSASLSIGPLRLIQQSGGKMSAAADLVRRALAEVSWLSAPGPARLYAVGGAWRAVARIEMRIRKYPLPVLHHFEFTRSEALDVCDLVARQSKRSLEEIPGLPRRRLDTLPFAALVLKSVLERTKIERVVVSAGGVREGLLYRALDPASRAIDPLLEGARFFAERLAPEAEMGAAAEALTDALFIDETPATRRVRRATCALIDVAAYFHPDLRGRQAFDTALRAPFYGVTHRERIAIALALFTRHEGRVAGAPDPAVVALLPDEERGRAMRLGQALRFAAALAPKAPHALAGARLEHEGDTLVFRAPERARALMGETPRKRLETLAEEFGARAIETYG
jgi:exopolyphosphatase/guanosine-5'-triphosphate,3'-diphosphate pyrophosphatase